MKTKTIALVVVVLLGSAILVSCLRRQYEIPERWDRVHIGMTRSQVYAVIAKPERSVEDINDFRKTVTGWQELHVFFDKDGIASDLFVIRFLGTRNTFMKQTVRCEF